jgi:hypothetical protein
MPIAQLPGDLQMYYDDDDFTAIEVSRLNQDDIVAVEGTFDAPAKR